MMWWIVKRQEMVGSSLAKKVASLSIFLNPIYTHLIWPALSSLSVSDLRLSNGMNLLSFSDESLSGMFPMSILYFAEMKLMTRFFHESINSKVQTS